MSWPVIVISTTVAHGRWHNRQLAHATSSSRRPATRNELAERMQLAGRQAIAATRWAREPASAAWLAGQRRLHIYTELFKEHLPAGASAARRWLARLIIFFLGVLLRSGGQCFRGAGNRFEEALSTTAKTVKHCKKLLRGRFTYFFSPENQQSIQSPESAVARKTVVVMLLHVAKV
jgi:hypothetical protein